MERGEAKTHHHRCPLCGVRSDACRGRCLEQCGCIGTPYCPHYHCERCVGYVQTPSYRQPGWEGKRDANGNV
jgi:hypothetical protein